MRLLLLVVPLALIGFAPAGSAPAQPARPLRAAAAPPAPAPHAPEPKYVDDDAVYDEFFDRLEELAKEKKPLSHKRLLAKLKPRAAGITPAESGNQVLAPEDVYKAAVQSVFVVGSVYPDKDGKWQTGTYATAWVLAADGVLVTNWHVFDELKDGEVFGAADRDGTVYPVTDFLGGDKTADVAVFRIPARELKPLPVAAAHAEVGSWVGVISHPGDLFYMYTQGAVTRYSTNTNDDKKVEKWMGISAEYASGSSGSPVLNKYGAVVGMAALTLSLDAADEPKKPVRRARPFEVPKRLARTEPAKDDKKDDKPKEPPKPGENPKGSPQQMVVRMAVPGPELLKWIGK
jgi:S1-C subfamily serine protease